MLLASEDIKQKQNERTNEQPSKWPAAKTVWGAATAAFVHRTCSTGMIHKRNQGTTEPGRQDMKIISRCIWTQHRVNHGLGSAM